MDESAATWSATKLAAAIRGGHLSSRELLDCYLDRIERLDGDVNAVVTLDVDRARAAADAADEVTVLGGSLGPLHGSAGDDQGRHRHRGHPLDGWRQGARRLRAHRGRARRRPPQGGRRHRVRQDQPAPVVERRADLQRALRRHEQSVGVRSHHRRIVGRVGRRGRRGVHELRGRYRHRRLGADPVALLRCLRAQAHVGSDPATRVSRPSRRAAPSTSTSTCSGRSRARRKISTSCCRCWPGPNPSARSRGDSSCLPPRSGRSATSTWACGSTKRVW